MNHDQSQRAYDVIISGAGPVGLFLACELALAKFAGTEPEFTGYSAHVDIVDPHKLSPGRNVTSRGMYLQLRPDGFVAWASDIGPDEQSIGQAAALWFGSSCAEKGPL